MADYKSIICSRQDVFNIEKNLRSNRSDLEKGESATKIAYLGISSDPIDLEVYPGDKIMFCMRPSVDAAALRILPKIKKRTTDADIVFLLSEITGKSKEDIVCNIAEGLEGKTVVSIVWYPKRKHGQRGIANTLERLGKCSAVVAIPQTSLSTSLELAAKYAEHILFMYQLQYANAEADTGKRILSHGGLLHLIQGEFEIEYLNLKAEGLPWSLSGIAYNHNLDTVMEYGSSALLNITVSHGTDPAIIQYIIEYIYSHLGEDGELNFSITVISESRDSVGIDLLVTDTVTATEESQWY